jgi:hypothetical protein
MTVKLGAGAKCIPAQASSKSMSAVSPSLYQKLVPTNDGHKSKRFHRAIGIEEFSGLNVVGTRRRKWRLCRGQAVQQMLCRRVANDLVTGFRQTTFDRFPKRRIVIDNIYETWHGSLPTVSQMGGSTTLSVTDRYQGQLDVGAACIQRRPWTLNLRCQTVGFLSA